jgi:ABC-type branched-subunit amino acid transport system substrate-binding protein
MRRLHLPRIVALLLAFALVAAACGDDDDDTEGAGDGDTAAEEETATEEAPAEEEESPAAEETEEAPAEEATDPPAEEETEEAPPAEGADASGIDPALFDADIMTDFTETSGPADDALEPVKIGMINQENDPVFGSFGEYRQGLEGAVAYINEQRGGIDGHPLEVVPCTYADAAGATECAQQLATNDELVLITGGVNIYFFAFDYYATIGDKPMIGGTPLFGPDYQAQNARYFFGGSLSVFAGMARFVAEGLGATKVVTMENDNPAAASAADLGLLPILEAAGVEVVRIKVPQPLTDASPQVQQAIDENPDYILTLTAAAECTPIIKSAAQLGWDMTKMVYTGTCNDTTVIDEVADVAAGGYLQKIGFNSADLEAGVAPASKVPELELLINIIENFSEEGTPEGAFANVGAGQGLLLERLLEEVGYDNLGDPAAIFAVADDPQTRNGPGGFPGSCAYADIGYPAVCGAANLFPVLQADGTTLPAEGAAAGIWNGMESLEPAAG